MKRPFVSIACAGVLALVLAGCGGQGGGSTFKFTDKLQQSLGGVQRETYLNQSGLIGPGGFGLAPGMGRGGLLGGLARLYSPFFMRGPEVFAMMEGGEGGSEPGEPGEGEGGSCWNGSDFYYDSWLELWVQIEETDNTYTLSLFVDEEKTQPAGKIVSSWPTDWENYPMTASDTYEITAGTMAGYHGYSLTEWTSESVGSYSYENFGPTGVHDKGAGTWSEGATSWTSLFEDGAGFWQTSSGEWGEDGEGTTTAEDSNGYKSTINYHADGSGDGLIEGPDEGLPATIVWDTEGNVTITWADGSKTHYNWGWCVTGSFGEGESGGGETGGSGGNSGPPSPPGG